MLKLFEVTGFKNFKDKITLNFADVHDYQFNTECVRDGLLSRMIVYGQNASGKSNLGLAIFDIVSHLTSNNVGHELYNYPLYAFSSLGYSEFHYIFIFGNDEVDYLYRKNDKRKLIYEAASINSEKLFSWNYETSSGIVSGLKTINDTLNMSIRGEDSILKYVIANSHLEESHPLYRMHRFVTNMLWFRNLNQNRYIGYKAVVNDYYDFIFKGDLLAEFEAFLFKAGIKERLIAKRKNDGDMGLYFDFGVKSLPFFAVASSGTRALYTVFYWLKTASNTSFLFMDEFDAFYHFEMAETLVTMLKQSSIPQVIFTSHNTNLLTNRLMRPDCYFILSGEKLTSFINATKRELREGHNLENLFKAGEFDA